MKVKLVWFTGVEDTRCYECGEAPLGITDTEWEEIDEQDYWPLRDFIQQRIKSRHGEQAILLRQPISGEITVKECATKFLEHQRALEEERIQETKKYEAKQKAEKDKREAKKIAKAKKLLEDAGML